jgi:hypothetical protein
MQPEELCEAIRQKCATRHWYGPGWPLPAGEDDPRQFDFVFPPLTEEQVDQAEAVLGFPLPPSLRALYTRLANGGFGPDCGFLRLAGEPSENDRTIVERYYDYTERCTFFDLEDQVQPGKAITFAYSVWPRFVVPICEEGCGNYFCLDGVTGHILTVRIYGAHEYCLAYVADSLEQWLQPWLESTLQFQ